MLYLLSIDAAYIADTFSNILKLIYVNSGPGSSVGIGSPYWLSSPKIDSLWGRDVPHLSRSALICTQPLVQLVPCLSRG